MKPYEYVQVLRAWWWVVAVTTVAAAVAGYGYGAIQMPMYRSTLRLEVSSRPDYGQIMAVEKLLRPIATRMTTSGYAAAVDERLGLGLGAGAIAGKVRTQVVPDALQIQVDVEDADPARAQQIARGLGDVAQERQNAAMIGVPDYQRILVSAIDQPSVAQQVWPPTRSLTLGGAMLGLMGGLVLAFVLEYVTSLKVGPGVAR